MIARGRKARPENPQRLNSKATASLYVAIHGRRDGIKLRSMSICNDYERLGEVNRLQ